MSRPPPFTAMHVNWNMVRPTDALSRSSSVLLRWVRDDAVFTYYLLHEEGGSKQEISELLRLERRGEITAQIAGSEPLSELVPGSPRDPFALLPSGFSGVWTYQQRCNYDARPPRHPQFACSGTEARWLCCRRLLLAFHVSKPKAVHLRTHKRSCWRNHPQFYASCPPLQACSHLPQRRLSQLARCGLRP